MLKPCKLISNWQLNRPDAASTDKWNRRSLGELTGFQYLSTLTFLIILVWTNFIKNYSTSLPSECQQGRIKSRIYGRNWNKQRADGKRLSK